MGFINKIFGKKNKENNMDAIATNGLENFSYQWIKGDNIGHVNDFKELVEVNGNQYIVFTDGSRLAVNLLQEFTVQVEKGFYEPAFDKNFQQPMISAPQSQTLRGRVEMHTVIKEESAIAAILKKQKENWVDVDLNLTINLPKRALWDVIISSFDNAEDEIIDYVTKDLDIEVVREALKKSIKDIYSSKITPAKNVRTQNPLSGQLD